jgi:hypothetical protein
MRENLRMYDPRTLIGRRLKHPDVVAVLRDGSLQIIYDIDLLAEGTADVYWIRDFAHGCCFGANEHQDIVTAWVHLRAGDGYQAFPWPLSGIAWDTSGVVGWGIPARFDRHRGISMARYESADLATTAEWDAAGPLQLTFMLPRVKPD